MASRRIRQGTAVRIEDIRVTETSGGTELSAKERDFRLWFRFSPEYHIAKDGDPFLAAFLLPAMLRGESLEIDPQAPVSESLLRSTRILQEIFHCWNPTFQKIQVACKSEPKTVRNQGVASFYSRGVDSNYTFLANRERITHLIAAHGFDFVVEDGGVWDPMLQPYAAVAARCGKQLVRVATNARKLAYPFTKMGWGSYFGSVLAAIGLALGFPIVYIPSSHTYAELLPDGSHALTDPQWSTEATRFIHDGGAIRRTEKVRAIVAEPEVLSNLWVCWENAETNCGRCSKCIRTMITLHLLGARSAMFPETISPQQVRRAKINGPHDLTFFVDNLRLAEQTGDRPFQRALRYCIRRYELSELAEAVDAQLFQGIFRRCYVGVTKLAGRQDPDRHASRVDFMR